MHCLMIPSLLLLLLLLLLLNVRQLRLHTW
jgi:hypothetical protein